MGSGAVMVSAGVPLGTYSFVHGLTQAIAVPILMLAASIFLLGLSGIALGTVLVPVGIAYCHYKM